MTTISNICLHSLGSPSDDRAVISLSLVLSLSLIKTMYYLRIFDSFSYLITLMSEVIIDLKQFMLFYMILIYMFSLILGVIGWQNYTRTPHLWEEFQETMVYPGVEYKHVGHFIGNMLTIARMTIGENEFSASHYIDNIPKNVIVFIVWGVVLFMLIIIYLNFIVAEAKSSFERVKKNL